jgi:hypothetical protein
MEQHQVHRRPSFAVRKVTQRRRCPHANVDRPASGSRATITAGWHMLAINTTGVTAVGS